MRVRAVRLIPSDAKLELWVHASTDGATWWHCMSVPWDVLESRDVGALATLAQDFTQRLLGRAVELVEGSG